MRHPAPHNQPASPQPVGAAALAGRPGVPIEPRPPLFSEEELEAFKAAVSPLISLDLGAYKPRQMERRITALMCRANAPNLEAYLSWLQADSTRLQAFINGLMINVTEFFRNPEKFTELRETILPNLLARFERLRIWSAGCSQGAELYSVGMVLEQLGALDRAELIGTDLDAGVIEKAPHGLFGAHEVQGLSPEVLERYFRPEGHLFRFTGEAIKQACRFERMNLLTDAPIAECHLVLCRNVVIYLNDASKRTLYQRFCEALVPGGILFVGSTERIFEHRELGLSLLAPFFYEKRS